MERKQSSFNKNNKKSTSYPNSKPDFKKDGKPFEKKSGSFKPNNNRFSKSYKKKETKVEDADGIRLNKYLAHAGIASRREADELILTGVVEVNGKVVQELGYKVQPTDTVRFDGRELKAERKVYVLLNKPKGFITTTNDEKMRKTVMDLVANASPYRIYPVGRLDRATTGVLLLTNDGDMAKKLTHPKHGVKKIYHVTLDKSLSLGDLHKIQEGIQLEEGVAVVDKISFIESKAKNELGVEINIGWNRVIRRIFESLGYEVTKLDRVYFGGLTKKGVNRGEWKILTEQEVNNLKML